MSKLVLAEKPSENGTSVLKPFRIDESIVDIISTGKITGTVEAIEQQQIFPGDSVLFVDHSISRRLAYYSYLIESMKKTEAGYST